MPDIFQRPDRFRAFPWTRWPWPALFKGAAPGVVIPENGWHAAHFATHGRALLLAMVRIKRAHTRSAEPVLRRIGKRLFRRQLEAIVARVRNRTSSKAEVVITISQHEALWMQAIQEVLTEQQMDFTLEMLPPIESVMQQSYITTNNLFGLPVTQAGTRLVAARANTIARRITSISETTRRVFDQTIRGAITAGSTVTETANQLREVVVGFEDWRVNMIARTEVSQAWTQAAVQSFKESETLTHVSVIGCESREEDRWNSPSYQQFMYHGESTCNIQDVPVEDADKLNFHPNHTGTMIPSRFRNEDGSISQIGD